MNTTHSIIEELALLIPKCLLSRSGKVFYSGRMAFNSPSSLYVLGLNPGGDPANQTTETVGAHTSDVLNFHPDDWSAYRDEAWKKNCPPGTCGMAPRVLHLFKGLGLNPGSVPCSNLIFVRSRREADLGKDWRSLAVQCWEFHAHAIERLQPRVILCFGKKTGDYVTRKVGAKTLIDEHVEKNNRQWRSQVFSSPVGMKVVVATHPSRVNWCADGTDPTPFVRKTLK